MGRQIIKTGGPARTRYRAIRAAFITLIVFICIVVLAFFVRGTHRHPISAGRPAGAQHAPAATNP